MLKAMDSKLLQSILLYGEWSDEMNIAHIVIASFIYRSSSNLIYFDLACKI